MSARKDNHEHIINQLVDGDQKAFKQLFDRYYSFAFNTALMYCSMEDAEEVVSDVFSRIWHKRQSLEEVGSFKNYLFIAIKNQCFNYLRKKKVDTTSIENAFHMAHLSDLNPHQELISQELEFRVRQAIDQLPPKCRQAFQLVKEDGLKYKEAAEKLSITVNTLDVHVTKATKRIMEVVKKYGIGAISLIIDIFERWQSMDRMEK